MKQPDLSGKEFAYLGHFRQPKFVEKGHNNLSLEELETMAARMEKDLGKGRPATAKPKSEPRPARPKSDMERIEDRLKLERELGLKRGRKAF